jgi:hypothetical protein
MDSNPPTADTGAVKEDAATAAAREELKQTVISEEGSNRSATAQAGPTGEKKSSARSPTDQSADHDSNDDSLDGEGTVAFTPQEGCSPKKKRAHDQVDNDNEAEDSDGHSDSSAGSRDRTTRLEPEKKRPRDAATATQTAQDQKGGQASAPKVTSSGAFATSGFAKLSSSSSPFGYLGGTSQPSIFSNAPSLSPAPLPSLAPTISSTSPFAGLGTTATNGFGGGFSGLTGFGALSPSGSISTFAKPGSDFKRGKPAKPFGAPESDAEEGAENESDARSGSDDSNDKSEDKDKDDEKKKPRLHKVNIDDGETGEATVLAVRAKLFYLNKESGWKERGAGMLKINIPECCVELDYDGVPIVGSFDASQIEAGKVPRLILRQDQTHRVLLNTAILHNTDFQEKTTLRATHVLFTSFEGEEAKPVSITAKMSAANAKSFLAELGRIQRKLRER